MLLGLDPYLFWFLVFVEEMERCDQRLQMLDYLKGPEYFADGWTPDDFAHAILSWRHPEV
jgi:hypothetical protein